MANFRVESSSGRSNKKIELAGAYHISRNSSAETTTAAVHSSAAVTIAASGIIPLRAYSRCPSRSFPFIFSPLTTTRRAISPVRSLNACWMLTEPLAKVAVQIDLPLAYVRSSNSRSQAELVAARARIKDSIRSLQSNPYNTLVKQKPPPKRGQGASMILVGNRPISFRRNRRPAWCS
jgi:hypothetical protein